MTPEQILADLRDIHLPKTAADAVSVDLVLWPLILVVLAALMVAWLVWRRRLAWRRDFFDDLSQIEHEVCEQDGPEGWAKLARLLKRLAIQRQGRQDVAALSGEPWLKQLDQLVGSDLFTNGSGRGLIAFPYQSAGPDQCMVDDLKATIEALRQQLPRLGSVRRRSVKPRDDKKPRPWLGSRQETGG